MSAAVNCVTQLPSFSLFAEVCQNGLQVVRPCKPNIPRDEWNHFSGYPPSHRAYGRMRTLLALKEVEAFRPRRLLEIAAGDGSLCACAAAMGCEFIVANDLRAQELEKALALFSTAAKVTLAPGDLYGLDEQNLGLFDLVVAREIVEHVAHVPAFLTQLKKHLAPDGHILLTTPNGAYFRNQLPTHSQIVDYTGLESRQFQPDADGHLFLLTARELTDVAQEAGLRLVRLNFFGTPFLSGHCLMRIISGPLSVGPAYCAERMAQRLPARWRERVCFGISAIFQTA